MDALNGRGVMADTAFYDRAYATVDPRWRDLSARGKAGHVEQLCARAGVRPDRVVEIGCGDGALLAALAGRGFARELAGFEISTRAVEQARRRGVARVEAFDGVTLPDGRYDLAVLSHVLEHVADPRALLREAARHADWVLVEVPLERNLSARRGSKRAGAHEIGHLQRFDRAAVRELAGSAGLEPVAELLDPLPRAVHTFFAGGGAALARASAKAALRRTIFRASPHLAARLFTLHYACLYAASSSSR